MMQKIRNRDIRFNDWVMESNVSARSITVELTEHVKSGDEADEAEAHHEHHRRRDLEAGSVVGVKPQHVASGAGSTPNSGGAVSSGSSADTTASHAGGGSSGSAGSHDSRSRGGGGCCGLRLRCASRHDAQQRRSRGRRNSVWENEQTGLRYREKETIERRSTTTLRNSYIYLCIFEKLFILPAKKWYYSSFYCEVKTCIVSKIKKVKNALFSVIFFIFYFALFSIHLLLLRATTTI